MTESLHIDELEQRLAACAASTDARVRIDLLNELAWALSDTDFKRAQALAEMAHAMASTPEDGTPAYEAGIAYSLRTLGYLNQRLGTYPLGLTQLLNARELCEALGLDAALADVFDGLAGIYFQIDDYPEALNYTYKQLAAAESAGDQRRVANAYNNLACIYVAEGDYARGIETCRRNLHIADVEGFARIKSLSLLNLAEAHLLAGDHAQALAYAQRGRRLCHADGFQLFEAHADFNVAKAYLKMGNQRRALRYLGRALAAARSLDARVTEAVILVGLGQAHRELRQFDEAVDILQQALATAQSVDAKHELFRAHLLLAEIHEQRGDAVQALHHFREYHAVNQLVYSEAADRRLKVLQVAHDTATVQREAEILRLKSQQLEQEIHEQKEVEKVQQEARSELERQVAARTAELSAAVVRLQQEIAERERAEAEITRMVATLEQRVATRTEELATFFDLTVLAGQAADITDVFAQVLPRIIEVTRSRAISIHLLDTGRTFLRLVAQENLPQDDEQALQSVELSPDFRRWLEEPGGLLVTTALTTLSGLPELLRLRGFQSFLAAQIRIGRQTEGILTCFRFTDRGFAVDEIALVTALAEQIGMVLETYRLRQSAQAMAVLEERQRLARDLHDSVTQSLYSLSLFSRAGREAAEDGDTVRLVNSLTEVERTTLHALREMRLLLYELRPADLEQAGLIPALELRLSSVERRVGLQVDAQLDELPGLARADEVQLYHIVVEAMNNVIKHAAATRMTLRLHSSDSELHLVIADDGQGFDPERTRGGMGLTNMRERVAQLGGRFSVASQPGKGTRLEAVIPYVAEGRS